MIFIIDRVGVQSGMHYYNDSFIKELLKIENNVKLISNYANNDKEQATLYNFYKGNFIKKVYLLLISYFYLYKQLKKSKEAKVILLFYGEWHDLFFLFICRLANKNIILDIHEVIGLEYSNSKILDRLIPFLINNLTLASICHSAKSITILKSFGYHKTIFSVPHFKYDFSNFNNYEVLDEIKNVFKTSKINILFFGQIRSSKGVDILFEALNLIEKRDLDKINVIIAGSDKEKITEKLILKKEVSVSIINRYINNNEMYYLYKNTDYIILPYKDISQSGVLEAALYFKKQLILSDLPYFNSILNLYPSFGYSFKSENSIVLKDIIKQIVNSPIRNYDANDYERYNSKEEVDLFLIQVKFFLKYENSNNRN